ncbi:unnamed protein product [Medioppia subpectinata]|uniref:F-box domain-containing protein n=1 Tax=Medioppia subpectinata TaxID=1979941 RepID=A0A7R9PXJ6_9ACAR|nr:unnamed protein product [Medioppia subpectinata]CAG2104463.1 unnamed protein product [Medioppia subpectinata]
MAQQLTHLMASLETTDDGNEDNYTQQPQMYAKDSLDRFGDDMFGILLSYLSLEDRFRCECVSKQFQRIGLGGALFGNMLMTTSTFLSKTTQPMETIAKKCPNIETIDCRGMRETDLVLRSDEPILKMLLIFRDNCRHLREIYCNLLPDNNSSNEEYKNDLLSLEKDIHIHYHRLSHSSISLEDLDNELIHYIVGKQMVTKNLMKLELNLEQSFSFDDNHRLSALFSDNQSLKCIIITEMEAHSEDTVTELAVHLSRLPQLQDLTLNLYAQSQQFSLAAALRTIGLNCKQLQRLSLTLKSSSIRTYAQKLDSSEVFRQLKRLHLALRYKPIRNWPAYKTIGLDIYIPVKTLTHLSFRFRQISGKLLDNCHELWPRLQYLFIECQHIRCLSHISRLPALQMLVIQCNGNNGLSDNDLNAVLSSSPKLKTIEIRVNNEKKIKSPHNTNSHSFVATDCLDYISTRCPLSSTKLPNNVANN